MSSTPSRTAGAPTCRPTAHTQEWAIPSEADRWKLTDPSSPWCPLSRFVGNEQAKKILQRAAFAAWGRHNHSCADLSFAMVGPASAGQDDPRQTVRPQTVHSLSSRCLPEVSAIPRNFSSI